MGWNGQGEVVRTDGVRTGSQVFQDQLAADVDIRADLMDTHANDLADAIEDCLNRNGENAATANISMGGHRITSLGTGTAATDAVTIAQAQGGGFGWGGTASGTANALVVGVTPTITSYSNGQRIQFIAASDNTADSPTINYGGGAIVMESQVGTPVKAREIRAGSVLTGVYVSTTPGLVITNGLTIEVPLPRGYIDGFKLSNDTDSDHDIQITAGAARSDQKADNIVLTSNITKRIDAAWAVGDDAGGLDTGSVASGAWYAIHVIKRLDTGVVDALFSLSASSPTLPSNYTVSRRVGWVRTDASANIITGSWRGERFYFNTAIDLDIDSTSIGATASLHTLTAPPDSRAIFNLFCNDNNASSLLLTPVAMSAHEPAIDAWPLASIRVVNTSNGSVSGPHEVLVNENSQIRVEATEALDRVRLATVGYRDTRGKDA